MLDHFCVFLIILFAIFLNIQILNQNSVVWFRFYHNWFLELRIIEAAKSQKYIMCVLYYYTNRRY